MALSKGKKRTFLVLTGGLLLVIIGLQIYWNANYSEGVRSGVVIKVSEKGVVFKTREAQLNLQSFGAVKSSNNLAEVFDFSIPKSEDSLYKVLQEVALSGERINLHYEEKYVQLFWRGDTKFFATKIERSGIIPEMKSSPVK